MVDCYIYDAVRTPRGKGFYDYPEGGRKHLWSGLSELVTTATEQPDVRFNPKTSAA
jgi:hypothetical protein